VDRAVDWRAVLPDDAPLPPPAYRAGCEAFVRGVREALGDDLVSAYLYGAVTFPRPEGWVLDVDFHTLLARPPTDARRQALRQLHADLAGVGEPGGELDGYHLLLADAGSSWPPTGVGGVSPSTGGDLADGPVDEAWALHRAHVRAGRVAVLHGLDPRGVVAAPSWRELLEGLRAELRYVVDHPEHAAFGVLSACRVAWSVEHRDVVVSKATAARWGATAHPAWAGALDAAVRAYTRRPRPGDDEVLARGRAAIVPAAVEALASAD